jgi:flavin reductase (DIM6/NTAB) family NADH-FMN oxidoreductase RutF
MPPHAGAIGPIPNGADPDAYDRLRRRVLWSMPSGLYLVGSAADGARNLMTCSFATQLATAPKLVGVGIEVGARTEALILAGGAFTLSLLSRDDRALVRKFVKPASDDRGARTLNGVAYRDAPVSGAPIPEAAVAFVDCRVRETLELGSHRLVIGEVVDGGAAEGQDELAVLRMEDTRMNYGG